CMRLAHAAMIDAVIPHRPRPAEPQGVELRSHLVDTRAVQRGCIARDHTRIAVNALARTKAEESLPVLRYRVEPQIVGFQVHRRHLDNPSAQCCQKSFHSRVEMPNAVSRLNTSR